MGVALQESLTERMGRGRLSVVEALRHATRIAAGLRDLHMQGLVYGAVSSQLILLDDSGATLRSSGGLAQFGDPRRDVQEFGAVLSEMLNNVEGPERLCAEIHSLAMRCQDRIVDMQQALIGLRLLRLQAEGAAVRRPVRPHRPGTVRGPLSTVLQWRPLAALAAMSLSGK